MVRRGRGGHVVNVSSVAGFAATSPLTAYATSKFGVFGLSEALREELRSHGIGVTTVCPGIINTPITRTSRMVGRFDTPHARTAIVEAYRRRNYGPERVAANVLKAVRKGRAVAPVSPEAWVMYLLKRFAPGLVPVLSRLAQARTERDMRRAAGGG
jgi:NAD(P)-dependent dehydrogenase (short-subunit alcohol dehydrogenase family)